MNMKQKKITISVLVLALLSGIAWFLIPQENPLIEHALKHADPTYVCPMHPQIIKNKAGTCPICGMDLVKKEMEKPQETVIEHALKHSDPTYVCPMHPQIVKNKEGTCPICGMDLVKKEPEAVEATTEKKVKYWVAPMDANYRRDKPGKSPMGMDLVPVYEEGNDNSAMDEFPSVKVKANTAQNMGIRTLSIRKKQLSRTIHTIGFINYNEDSLHHVHSRTNGWLEKIHIKAEGDTVKKGSILADFYSPDIVAAEKDLLIARRSGKLLSQSGAGSLLEAAKQKLRLLEVPESVIKRIQSTGKSQNTIPILAPHNGVVIKMGVRDGMYVTPKLQMYSIADLSSVWVQVDVFGHHFDWVNVGNKAEITVEGLAGKTWTGKVDYIYPELNPVNRTLKVRLKFNTPKQKLKPNMFANVTLFAAPKNVLSVPNEAVIYYENSPRLIKVVGKDRYQPVEVKLGMRSEGHTEILAGLEENDKVVVSGQFMLDSESNLQASFRRLAE